MKIISHTNEGREYLLCGFPEEGFKDLETEEMMTPDGERSFLLFTPPPEYFDFIQLPQGPWQILGLASEVGEDVAGGGLPSRAGTRGIPS